MGNCQTCQTKEAASAVIESNSGGRGAPDIGNKGDSGSHLPRQEKPTNRAVETSGDSSDSLASGGAGVVGVGSAGGIQRGRLTSYASGASTPDDRSDTGSEMSFHGSERSYHSSSRRSTSSNPKMLGHSASAIGLDEMIETRREDGGLRQNVVHIEIPFGKPIEEVYDGVHTGPVLGSGISGLVRLVTHKATGIKYAVKCLDLGLVDTAEGLQQLREEIFIMCQLDHPNIVRLEEVYESHSEIYLVQELCLGGELFDRLDEQPDYHYTEAQCARLVKMMLCAVRYLHSKGIIHRDLKLENFLFSSTAQDSELKMIDFGLSKHFRYGEVQHEAVGTPYTVAPEVIKGSYDERCDIWAIGVITFLLLSGDPPFGGCGGPEPLMAVRANILKGSFAFEPEDIWSTVSPLAREFIKKLLVVDPKMRPTAKEGQKHPWLKEWASRTKREDDNVLNPNVVKALVNFKEFSDMRKLLCEVLSFTLLPDQIKELRGEFEKMDKDESGEISLAALKEVLMTNANQGALGALKEDEVEDIFNAMRVRKTETRIHWHEFLAAGLSQCQVDDRNLRLAFDRLDSDHKGYITLDDIMDLMGNDAMKSEEAMRRMWGDSMKLVKGQHARITYDGFLLLMKGQTAETTEFELENSIGRLGQSTKLDVVPEIVSEVPSPEANEASRSDEIVDGNAGLESSTIAVKIVPQESTLEPNDMASNNLPQPAIIPKAAREGPPDELDFPLSMDEADDLDSGFCKPGVPGTAASLTPPTTPTRGAEDYITPLSGRRNIEFNLDNCDNMMMPGFPQSSSTSPGVGMSSDMYIRRRSRSLGEEETAENGGGSAGGSGVGSAGGSGGGSAGGSGGGQDVEKETLFEKNARRAMLLPEHDHTVTEIDALVKDETKSALVVNRKLYRAHRQMRLAVLEASKRFEEQQARHARDVILAQREIEETGGEVKLYHAGLVMRHGHKQQVSSEEVKRLLKEHREKQQVLVEKATKRGGRGRRSRKKTCSDMSGMLSSLGQDEMTNIAVQAAAPEAAVAETEELSAARSEGPTGLLERLGQSDRGLGNIDGSSNNSGRALVNSALVNGELNDVDVVMNNCEQLSDVEGPQIPPIRGATVPGEFRKTKDPFGAEGKYGVIQRVDLTR